MAAGTKQRRAGYWVPALLWMMVIYWMSTDSFSAMNTGSMLEYIFHYLLPGVTPDRLSLVHHLVRKTGHVAEYFVLGLLLFRAFRGGSADRRLWRWAAFAFVALVLYAISDELHQMFVPSRTASAADVFIDASGGVMGQIVSVWRAKTSGMGKPA